MRPAAAERQMRGLPGEGTWEPEVGEQAAVAEPGDGRDVVAFEGDYEQSVAAYEVGLGVWEVAPEGGLTVGPGGDESQVAAEQRGAVVDECGDGGVALVLVRFGGHCEPGVVGEQGNDTVDVTVFERGDEAAYHLQLTR